MLAAPAAVHDDRGAGHVGRLGAREPGDRAGDRGRRGGTMSSVRQRLRRQ